MNFNELLVQSMQTATLQHQPVLGHTLPGPSPFDLYTWIIHQINKQPISLPVNTRQSSLLTTTTCTLHAAINDQPHLWDEHCSCCCWHFYLTAINPSEPWSADSPSVPPAQPSLEQKPWGFSNKRYLQANCPSCHPTTSVKAQKGTQNNNNNPNQ